MKSVVPLAPLDVARRATQLNDALGRGREVPPSLVRAFGDLANSARGLDWIRCMRADPERAIHGLTALVDVQNELLRRDEGAVNRDAVRSALVRMAQALFLVAESEPVSPDRTVRELTQWLIATVPVPQRDLAELVGVSLRSFQRWASPAEPVQPHADRADRLRTVAAVVNQLRFSLVAAGIVRWFDYRNGWLDGKRPRALLSDPGAAPLLIAAASAVRESGGS